MPRKNTQLPASQEPVTSSESTANTPNTSLLDVICTQLLATSLRKLHNSENAKLI